MPPRFDLVLLDLDGTLVDSQAILVGLVNDTLASLGWPAADPAHVAMQIGLPLEQVFRSAVAAAGKAAIAALCDHYRRLADAPEFVRQFRLYDGVASTLARLHRDGMKLVVATSKGRATTLDILRHCGIDGLIDDAFGGDCVEHGKPHPEMVHRARDRFGVAADRTVMIGDTSFDIQMGHAAGVSTGAVTYGMHDPDTLRALRPSFVVDRFDELTQILTDART